jgi:hypothetical protein
MRTALSAAIAVACIFNTTVQVHGQIAPTAPKCQHQFVNVTWNNEGDNKIRVFVDGDFYRESGTTFRVVNLAGDLTPVPIEKVDWTPTAGQPPGAGQTVYNALDLTPLVSPAANVTYYLVASNVHFADCKTLQALVGPTQIQIGRKVTKAMALGPATSRDDADFYLAPTIDGATGTKASYTADAKFSPEIWLRAPGTQWSFFSPGVILDPDVDIKISSNAKEDGNSVTFQALLKLLYPTPRKLQPLSSQLPMSIGKTGFAVEADKNFHDLNGVFTYTQALPLHTYCCGRDAKLFFEPLLGTELGTNLKSQSAGAYPYNIVRGFFGAHEGFNVFSSKHAAGAASTSSKPMFSIETDYIRRLLVNPEPVYVANSQNKLVLQSSGTQPRDHVTAAITYNVSAYFGFTANYEYGSLPPDYTLVDNKYTFGLVLKGQLQSHVK